MRQGLVVAHVVRNAGSVSEHWINDQLMPAGDVAQHLLFDIGDTVDPYAWTEPSHRVLGVRRVDRAVRRLGRIAPDVTALVAPAFDGRLPAADVYHAHFGPVGYAWHRLARANSVPLIVSFYGTDASNEQFRRAPWSRRYADLFETVSAVIVEGPSLREKVIALGCPSAKVHVIRLPCQLPSMGTTTEDKRYAAFLGGRFVEKKGFDTGIRAFARAFPYGPERLAIVGDGKLRGSLEAIARSEQLEDRVEFLGSLTLQDFVMYLCRAKVALFPSQTAVNGDSEGGAPVALTIAQACGVATVVSDHADLPWAAAPVVPVVPEAGVAALSQSLAALHEEASLGTSAYIARTDAQRQFVARENDPARLAVQRARVYSAAALNDLRLTESLMSS